MDPRARVGDADREETVAALKRYVSEGYLSLDEFSDRSAAVYRATTYGELAALTQDLSPRADPDRSPAGRVTGRITWTPVMIAVAVVVGVVVVVAVVMVVMMLGMMGSMGGMR